MVAPTAHKTHQKFLIRLFPQNEFFSLVMMLMLITQSLYDSSLQDTHHRNSSHTYICHTSHILLENLQEKNQGACQTLGIV